VGSISARVTDKTEKWAPATEADLPEQVQALAAYRRAETAELQALIIGDLSVRWTCWLMLQVARRTAVQVEPR
jgi:hypothetical protein